MNLKTFELRDVRRILDELSPEETVVSVTVKAMLDRPIYELTTERNGKSNYILVDGMSGEQISPINEETAKMIAQNDFERMLMFGQSS